MQSSPASCHFLLLRLKYSQHPVHKRSIYILPYGFVEKISRNYKSVLKVSTEQNGGVPNIKQGHHLPQREFQ